jgi:WD40 repeat protein
MSLATLDFSDAAPFTGPLPAFSPDGRLVAAAVDARVVVRDVESLAVAALFSCAGRVDALAWAPGGDRLLAASYARGVAHVFSVSDLSYAASVSEGAAGVAAARWCPSGAALLLTADFRVRLSVWPLGGAGAAAAVQLSPPKHEAAGLGFSPDGSLLAVLERFDSKDTLALYDAATWTRVAEAALPTVDAADLAWSPDSRCLALWDAPEHGHNLLVYSRAGEPLGAHAPADRHGLGVRGAAWSPSGALLLVAAYEGEAALLNAATWEPLAHFSHAPAVAGPPEAIAYKEEVEAVKPPAAPLAASNVARGGGAARPHSSPSRPSPGARAAAAAAGRALPARRPRSAPGGPASPDAPPAPAPRARYEVAPLPLRLPYTRPPLDKPNPRMGVGLAEWSPDGSCLATRADASPAAAWVWDSASLQLAAVLLHATPVRALAWDPAPGARRLALAAGEGRLHLWAPGGASCVRVPVPGLRAGALRWAPGGGALLVADKESFCIAYLNN